MHQYPSDWAFQTRKSFRPWLFPQLFVGGVDKSALARILNLPYPSIRSLATINFAHAEVILYCANEKNGLACQGSCQENDRALATSS